jgi:hypothetical protein
LKEKVKGDETNIKHGESDVEESKIQEKASATEVKRYKSMEKEKVMKQVGRY